MLGAGRQVCHPEQRVRRDDGSATANAFATVRTLVRAACQRRFNAAACRGGRAREAGIRRRGSTNGAGFARKHRPAAHQCRVDHAEPDVRFERVVEQIGILRNERDASWRFVLRRHPSTRHRLLDPLIAFLRREADAPPFVAKIVAPASNDSHARGAGGA